MKLYHIKYQVHSGEWADVFRVAENRDHAIKKVREELDSRDIYYRRISALPIAEIEGHKIVVE